MKPCDDCGDGDPGDRGQSSGPAAADRLPIEPELVRVPGGPFWMGSDRALYHLAEDELPRHRVTLRAYQIGRYPVTNVQYAAFIQATDHRFPADWQDGRFSEGLDDYPVVDVTWRDAQAYVAWLRKETGRPYRLPSEAEWEKAARGTDERIYPWGNDWDADRCNSYDRGLGRTTPVGNFSPAGDSPYGCVDMAGNVWEWCQSLYKPYPYQADDGREDLEAIGPRVLRGGAFFSNERSIRCACRGYLSPELWIAYFGFRVVVAPGDL